MPCCVPRPARAGLPRTARFPGQIHKLLRARGLRSFCWQGKRVSVKIVINQPGWVAPCKGRSHGAKSASGQWALVPETVSKSWAHQAGCNPAGRQKPPALAGGASHNYYVEIRRDLATSSQTSLTEEDRLRANTYALLAKLLAAPPSEELRQTLCQIEDTESEYDEGAAAWRLLKQAAQRATEEVLIEEYHALFIGVGRGELMPYGAWYLTGFLMEKPLVELRRDLLNLGFERQAGVKEPEDHICALCEVMSMLIGSEPPASLETQQHFFTAHIAPWMGRFFKDLSEAQSARFYRAVGQLGERLIRIEAQYFAMLV
jgi:Uncharacterized component of anaerobic dehydrogenases